MKITFLVPPVLDGTKPTERASGCTYTLYSVPNIYELSVAAVLERDGHDVRYIDFVLEGNKPEDFNRFLSNDDSDAYSIWTVNLGIENDLMVRDNIRKFRPQSHVLFLGPAPTFYTDKFLTEEKSIALRGEPEETISELLKAIEQRKSLDSINGISYLENGIIKHNGSQPVIKDLDGLPFPARHLVEKYSYHNPKLKLSPYTMVVSSRNCPHKCIYCVPSSLTFARELEYRKTNPCKPPITLRSTENVGKELELLANAGYKAISFQDDNFIWNEKRTLEICKYLKKYKLLWGCQARVDAITENIAKALGESDCQFIDLGVESFNQEILDYIKKGITEEQIYNAVNLLKKYNVPVKLNILLGTSPLETKKTIKETFKKIRKLGVNQVMFNIAAPFPGTEFYDLAIKNKWMIFDDYKPTDVQKKAIVNYPQISAEEMEKLLFWGNVRFFLNPAFIARNIIKFRNFKDFTSALKALKRKLVG